jgi:hypothetical protein
VASSTITSPDWRATPSRVLLVWDDDRQWLVGGGGDDADTTTARLHRRHGVWNTNGYRPRPSTWVGAPSLHALFSAHSSNNELAPNGGHGSGALGRPSQQPLLQIHIKADPSGAYISRNKTFS